MPSAEIITIGTEILLGEIVDTNARAIARMLRDAGIDLYRKTTVGDNPNRIAQAIQQAMDRCEIILTTGGLGPTIDDPTRQAVAQAVGVEIEFRPELWDQIQERFQRYGRLPTENNKRQAYIPLGATAIENPVGTAPAFFIENNDRIIISLPGVPREMDYLMQHEVLPFLKEKFHLQGVIKSRILHTVGVGESVVDDLIGDFEILTNPTVGLAAHSGQVDVRITAKADSEQLADIMILEVEKALRILLKEWIYGADEESLEQAAFSALERCGWNLTAVEHGIGGALISRLAAHQSSLPGQAGIIFIGGSVINSLTDPSELAQFTREYGLSCSADCCLGAAVLPNEQNVEIYLVLITPQGEQLASRPYGGPREYAARYAVHNGLDLLRRIEAPGISNDKKGKNG